VKRCCGRLQSTDTHDVELLRELRQEWRSERAWPVVGAGANARRSIGITVFSGMLASTCLAVLFVPSFFVVLQKAEEHRAAARKRSPARSPAE
jgi:hypothetical protein